MGRPSQGKWVQEKTLVFPPDEDCYIYKRPNSSIYQYFLSIPGEGEERKSTKQKTKEDALRVARDRKLEVMMRQKQGLKAKRVKKLFDFIDDYLAEERLGEEGLEFTELDYDALNVNFLEDLLDIISELDKIQDEDRLAQEATTTTIKGTSVGQDTKTQITTIVTGEKIKMTRAVESNAAINIDSGNSYTVVLEQNGVVNEVKVNGGSASTIVIRQSSG